MNVLTVPLCQDSCPIFSSSPPLYVFLEDATTILTQGEIDLQAITTDKIADRAVTTAELADRAVTQAKIANAAVSTLQLGLGAVTPNEIASLAVTNPKVALKAIRETNIDAQGSALSSVLMATRAGNVSFSKISSASFDGSLTQQGATLGCMNGISLAPVGGHDLLYVSNPSWKWRCPEMEGIQHSNSDLCL